MCADSASISRAEPRRCRASYANDGQRDVGETPGDSDGNRSPSGVRPRNRAPARRPELRTFARVWPKRPLRIRGPAASTAQVGITHRIELSVQGAATGAHASSLFTRLWSGRIVRVVRYRPVPLPWIRSPRLFQLEDAEQIPAIAPLLHPRDRDGMMCGVGVLRPLAKLKVGIATCAPCSTRSGRSQPPSHLVPLQRAGRGHVQLS